VAEGFRGEMAGVRRTAPSPERGGPGLDSATADSRLRRGLEVRRAPEGGGRRGVTLTGRGRPVRAGSHGRFGGTPARKGVGEVLQVGKRASGVGQARGAACADRWRRRG